MFRRHRNRVPSLGRRRGPFVVGLAIPFQQDGPLDASGLVKTLVVVRAQELHLVRKERFIFFFFVGILSMATVNGVTLVVGVADIISTLIIATCLSVCLSLSKINK